MIENLRKYLEGSAYAHYPVENLTEAGLAHWHFRLVGSDKIVRIPKQSQMNLAPLENLRYQKTCYQAMLPSGNTPRCYKLISPNRYLTNGALVVEEIKGDEVNLKKDFLKIAKALTNIHALPTNKKTIIWKPDQPIKAMLKEVADQMVYLEQSPQSKKVSHLILSEFNEVKRKIKSLNFEKVPLALISFDCHPGNFIINEEGKAILVDLEKCRYSYPGFDLAHASLYTSTTWGKTKQELPQNLLNSKEVITFYQKWLRGMPLDHALKTLPSLLILRTLMWLWSITWCGKWLVESKLKKNSSKKQNWSSELSSDALIEKVRFNVEDCLLEKNVAKVTSEWSKVSKLNQMLSYF